MKMFLQYIKRFILAVCKWTILVIIACVILHECGLMQTLSVESWLKIELPGSAGVAWGLVEQMMNDRNFADKDLSGKEQYGKSKRNEIK